MFALSHSISMRSETLWKKGFQLILIAKSVTCQAKYHSRGRLRSGSKTLSEKSTVTQLKHKGCVHLAVGGFGCRHFCYWKLLYYIGCKYSNNWAHLKKNLRMKRKETKKKKKKKKNNMVCIRPMFSWVR